MNLLLIETATAVCSTALACDGQIVAHRKSSAPNAHSVSLPLFIRELLALQRPDAVCISAGPGSYTGLRIGTSTAKGICYALDLPLLSVSTLLSMASLYYRQHPAYCGLVCPMIDARRMECYTLLVAPDLRILRPVGADIITPDLYSPWLGQSEVVFIGDGAAKTQPLLGSHPNARFDPSFSLSAEGLLPLAESLWHEGKREDVAYYEPFYLKDFVAKKSVVHGLRD